MSPAFTFSLSRQRFDEHYCPADTTRVTTNFANLARGEHRQQNLRNTLRMIDNRFNDLAHWDNPRRDRYAVGLEIISAALTVEQGTGEAAFPLIEVLNTRITDRRTGECIDGTVGNNFSSYVRDYDFSVVLPDHNRDQPSFSTPADFGELHGKLFKHFIQSPAYTASFAKPPVICISVSTARTYLRTGNQHPVLGIEYQQDALSSTDDYFARMGMQVRFFMPPNSVAPLAFYFIGDLLADYTDLELIATISTMESFQRIYRPEIYNANAAAGHVYQPSLTHQDYSTTRIEYDRRERSELAVKQGRFTEEHFIKPYQRQLAQWAARCAL